MPDHTPGPWYVPRGNRFKVNAPIDPADGESPRDDYRIANTWSSPSSPVPDQAAANARLIAAAPCLLEACQAAESLLWMAERYAEAGGARGPEMLEFEVKADVIRKAILKAKGGT